MVWNVRLPDAEYYTADDPRLAQIIAEVAAEPEVAIDTETTGLIVWKDMPLFFSLAWGNRRMCLPADALQRFKPVFDDPEKNWVLANAKYDQHILANAGCPLQGKLLDTQVMHALLYDEHPHGLDYMGKQLLGWQWKDMFDEWDKKKQPNVGDFILGLFARDPTRLTEYASNDAYGTYQIFLRLKHDLMNAVTYSLYPDRYRTMWDYFYKIEVPFTKVLWKCERNGTLIDVPYLANIAEKAGEDLKAVEREATKLVGRPINLSSRVQLSQYFFEELKLRPLSMSKGGKRGIKVPQVNYDFLEHYAAKVPFAKLMMKYNDLSKLKGTYADGLPTFLDRHNRIHTRFNQDVARTGRLSSAGPNLQNIPNAESDPWQIRAAFIAAPGKVLIDFDYSALEMRLLAAASLEPGMVQAFKDGLDPHSFNAADTFNLPYADIVAAKKKEKKDLTDYDKRCVKARSDVKTTVGFGVLYGMKEKSLALRLGCSEQEAIELIRRFMDRNPSVKQFMDEALEETRKTGYAYTILGRRRYLPEILSPNRGERSSAERQAGNLPIQGSAADAAKMAMILIDEADLETRFGCKMQIQVHDEIISECPEETADEAMEEIRMWMEHPFPTDLVVELKTEGKKAKNWADAK
jgi:DNA polymerase-1